MNNWYVYLVVVVSGASVLAIEILGTRLIGPKSYTWAFLLDRSQLSADGNLRWVDYDV